VALEGGHRAIFSSNANDPDGALDLEIQNGARLRSSILALRYFDAMTGKTATLGTVQDARGELLPPNQVIYRNVFDSVPADLVYTYRKNGVEADVVLREIPPNPEEFGLVPATTRLEVVTEFFDPPKPAKREEIVSSLDDPSLRNAVAEADWIDEELDFGAGRFGPGRAFAWSAREAAQRHPQAFSRVGKRWIQAQDGRTLLIESVDYAGLLNELLELPGTAHRVKSLRELSRAWATRSPEEIRNSEIRNRGGIHEGAIGSDADSTVLAQALARPGANWAGILRPSAIGRAIETGMALADTGTRSAPGLVLDWSYLTSGSVDFTFAATNTYYVTGNCTFTGTTTIEGGTVVKFPVVGGAGSSVSINGPVVCKTSAYRPAIFTAENDNTAGESILTGTPDPAADYGTRQLRFSNTGVPVVLEHLRLRYGNEGLYFEGSIPDVLVRHCQVVNSRFPISSTTWARVRLENVLVQGGKSTGRAFTGSSTPFQGDHLTIHQFPSLLSSGSLVLTNSIVAAVTSVQAYSGSGNWQATSSSGLFESLGGGRHYLPQGSALRNAGVAGIRPLLREDLMEMTTDAPQLIPGTTISDGTIFFPRARRDTDALDIGYHYPPIDYVPQGQTIQNASVQILDGTVLGVFGTWGFVLGPGARFESRGTATAQNRWVYHGQIQEWTASSWAQTTGDLALFSTSWGGTGVPPLLRCEFTEAIMPGGPANRRLLLKDANAAPLSMAVSHSQFRSLSLNLEGLWPGIAVNWTNNLVEDSDLRFWQSSSPGYHRIDLVLFHQLFRGGRVILQNARSDSAWVIRDNLFDPLELVATTLQGSFFNNGFRSGLTSFGASARSGLTMDFVSTPRAAYLYPTFGGSGSLASLLDAGSRSAPLAGLSPFTVRSDGNPEGAGTVDIGYHYPAPEPTSTGLVAHWKLDESSGTIATDSSPLANHGTLLNGPVRGPAHQGNGLFFDGINDQVTVPDSPSLRLPSTFTIAFWVKKHAEPSDFTLYIGKGSLAQRNFCVWDTAGPSGKLLLQYQTSGGSYVSFTSQTELTVNRWYHVVCTRDGTTGRIYIDGKLDASAPMSAVAMTSSDPLVVGYAGYHGRFSGVIDEISIFDRALAESELPALMNGISPGTLPAHRRGQWRLNQASGSVVQDSSGRGHTGSLNNGPQWVAGRYSNGLSFNGVDDQVTIADAPSLRLSTGYTIAFWMNKSAEPADFSRMVGKGNDVSRNFGIWDVAGSNARVMFQFRVEGGAYRTLTSSGTVPVGTWRHVGVTWDGFVGRIYLDGILDSSAAMPGPAIVSADPMTFGFAGYHTRYAGKLDEVVVLNRAATATEMANLAAGSAPTSGLPGLVGVWPLNQASGNQAIEASGSSLHGDLSLGPKWSSGRTGNAIAFDGLFDSVSIPDHPDLRPTSGWTLAFWVRKRSENQDYVRYVGKGGTEFRNYGVWDEAGSGGRVLFQFRNPGGAYQTLISRGSVPVGVWKHVACTWDGSTGRIYFDGQLDSSGTMQGPPAVSSEPLTLGYAGYHGRFAGDLDEVELFDRALADAEIADLLRWVPSDSDRDGLPDATEDRNGNGVRDAGETSLADLDSDYDGRSDAQERIDGTDSTDSRSVKAVRLGMWNFDTPSDPWRGDNGSVPWERSGVGYVELSSFVYGAELNTAGATLRYRDVEPNGRANINARQGTVRLHYFPYWASVFPACPGNTAGSGPGATIELLSVGDFSIGIDAKGTNLFLRSPAAHGGWVTNAQAKFHACAGEYPPDFPMDIQVSYGTNASAIFLNGELLARGTGIQTPPNPGSRTHGLFVGSNPDRGSQIKGVMDAVLTYNVPLDLCTNAWTMHASVNTTTPSVTLNWTAVPDCYYLIERRSPPEVTWQRMASVKPPSFTDSTVLPGREYEYRLRPDSNVPEEFLMSTDPAHLTLRTGVRLSPNEAPGRLLLVVDRTLISNPAFSTAVTGLTRDLSAEGWIVSRYEGPRHDDTTWANNPARIAEVKNWIQANRNAYPNDTRAVYLLGHLPIPRSGMLSPDGHSFRPLPTDAYFGDLDGSWTDSTNWVAGPGIEVPNLAGDGIFDQELIPANGAGLAEVELAVGRVDFANMPAFAGGSSPRSEVDLLVQYLAKTRRYRRGELTLPERAIYGAYFSSNATIEASDRLGQALSKVGLRLGIATQGANPAGAVKADFFTAGLPAVWGVHGGFAGGYSLIHSRAPVNTYHGIVPHQTTDLLSDAAEPPIAFSIVEGSWFPEWNAVDHLGRGLMATRNYGYAWSYAGASRVEWQYPVMAMGKTLGEAWRKTQNDAWMWPFASVIYQPLFGTGSRVYFGNRSQGGYVFATLLGDPTLRQEPGGAAEFLSGQTTPQGSLALSWAPSSVPETTYHIYRNTQGIGGSWTRLTSTPVSTSNYTDVSPPGGLTYYMVRNLTLKTVASGSFTNLSAGTLWP